MFETARYEASRRRRGTAVLAVGISLYAAFVVWYFTQFEGVDMDQLLESMPPAMLEAFGIETMTTIEGFLGAQFYSFVWLLGLGLYFAYAASGLIAGDVERDRLDLILSLPVSRARLLLEKFASLLVPLVVLNVVVGAVIYVTVLAIGESIDPANLVLVHLLSIPYLLVCASIGVVLSVLVDRVGIAQRVAIALVFVLFLVESMVAGTGDLEWLQYLSPTHYYEPTQVLLEGSYELVDTGILLALFLVLLVGSQLLFRRRDI